MSSSGTVEAPGGRRSSRREVQAHGLQQSAGQLIVALESGAVLLDAAPEDDAGAGAGEEAGEEAGDQPEDGGGAPASDGGMSAGEDDTPADDGTPRTETGEPAE